MDEPADVEIVRRRVDLQFDPAAAVHWYPGAELNETLLNAISFFFPPGEKFFIDSVQHYQDRIQDPQLREQVRRFIYQEAMHTSMHQRCNKVLRESYPMGPRIERLGGFFLNQARWLTPRSYQLAVSCAIEHFTATLSDQLLRRLDKFARTAHPDFVRLWAWHAVEETEHKGVCFDVYRTVVGAGPIAYLIRATAMLVTTFYFTLAVGIGIALIRSRVRGEGKNAAARDKLRGHSSMGTAVNLIPWRLWRDYFRPSFHPWDHDNRALIDAWKQRYPDFGRSPDPS